MYIDLPKTGKKSIKEVPDLSASVINLQKYKKSKIPGTFDIQYIGKGPDKRWLTGIDEQAYDLLQLATKGPKGEEELKAKQKEITALRKELQIKLGVADLSPANDEYWSKYRVFLHILKSIDLDNPQHQLAVRVMIANRFIMPDLSYRTNPAYLRTKFYLHDEVVEAAREAANTADKDKAFAELYNLFKTENPKLHAIGKLIFRGRPIAGMAFSTLYNQFKMWLGGEIKQENSRQFIEYLEMNNDILSVRDTMLTASERGLLVTRNKKLHYGETALGRTLEEVYSNMLKDEYAVVFQMIQEDVENNKVRAKK